MWPFKKKTEGAEVLHFEGRGPLEGKRIHLRIDGPDRGILILDASRMLLLNGTGIEFSKAILEGLDDQNTIRRIRKKYRVKKEDVKDDLDNFRKEFDSLLTSTEIISDMEDDLEKLYEDQKAPYRMDLALTYGCNNNCLHCYNEKKDGRELSTDEWKKVLDKLWSLGIPHIVFTGGEPTLRNDLPDLIAHAEDLGQITGLNTNGRRLSDPRFLKKLLDAGLDHVQITVGSINEGIHDSITRTKGSYRETIKGLKNCIESDIYLVTNTTIMEENRDSIISTIESLQKMGVEHVAVNSIIRSGKGKDAKGIPVKELEKILIKGRELGLETGTEFRWYSPTPYCKLNPMELGLGLKQCSACRLNMAVEPDGNVIPCQSYYEGMGNITTNSWSSIWEHDLCRKIRERKELPKECEGCDLQTVCGGGCPLSWSKGDYVCHNVLSS